MGSWRLLCHAKGIGSFLINNRGLMKMFKLGNEMFFRNTILEADGRKTGEQTVVAGGGSQEDASTDGRRHEEGLDWQ